MYAAQAAGCGAHRHHDPEGHRRARAGAAPDHLQVARDRQPADGYYAYRAVKDSGGYGEHATDEEIIEGMRLLAAPRALRRDGGGRDGGGDPQAHRGRPHPRDEPIVMCVTGNGLKTPDALHDRLHSNVTIRPSLTAFEAGRWPTSSPGPGRSPEKGDPLHGRSGPHSHAASAASSRARPRSRPTRAMSPT